MTFSDRIEELRAAEEAVIAEADAQIEKAIKRRGPFTHNAITWTLQHVARQCGYARANQLVVKHKLTERFGIEEQTV